ncbi:hypothetical protein FKM82_026593 [Ascaphus truei]
MLYPFGSINPEGSVGSVCPSLRCKTGRKLAQNSCTGVITGRKFHDFLQEKWEVVPQFCSCALWQIDRYVPRQNKNVLRHAATLRGC